MSAKPIITMTLAIMIKNGVITKENAEMALEQLSTMAEMPDSLEEAMLWLG